MFVNLNVGRILSFNLNKINPQTQKPFETADINADFNVLANWYEILANQTLKLCNVNSHTFIPI